jgi:flagellar basal body-associated protein FliL
MITMKLTFLNLKKKKRVHKKLHLELDPHRYWILLLAFFMVALAAELVYFSFLFLQIQKRLDAPATPVLETNAAAINRMERSLEEVQAALGNRVKKVAPILPETTSQKTQEVVQ